MEPLKKIQAFVQAGKYRVKIHALRHLMEDGFEERHIAEAIATGKILEHYAEESRCLVVGTFHWTPKSSSSLHVICDYGQSDRVEFVTAYIPQRPEWVNPKQRGKKKR